MSSVNENSAKFDWVKGFTVDFDLKTGMSTSDAVSSKRYVSNLKGMFADDIGKLTDNAGCTYTHNVIGGFGSIQLFVITKQGRKVTRAANSSMNKTHSKEKSITQLHEKINAVNTEIEKLQRGSGASYFTNHDKHELNDLYQKREEYNHELERMRKAAADKK